MISLCPLLLLAPWSLLLSSLFYLAAAPGLVVLSLARHPKEPRIARRRCDRGRIGAQSASDY